MIEAVVKSPSDFRWCDFVPEFRVLPSIPQVAAEELTEAVRPLPASAPFEAREKLRVAGERRRALLLFRHGFPPEIAKPVGRIPTRTGFCNPSGPRFRWCAVDRAGGRRAN